MACKIRLVHYDDGKGTDKSHEVYLQYYEEDESADSGFGATAEEAYENFKKEFLKAMNRAKNINDAYLETNALWPPIEVDDYGRDIHD